MEKRTSIRVVQFSYLPLSLSVATHNPLTHTLIPHSVAIGRGLLLPSYAFLNQPNYYQRNDNKGTHNRARDSDIGTKYYKKSANESRPAETRGERKKKEGGCREGVEQSNERRRIGRERKDTNVKRIDSLLSSLLSIMQ